MIQITYHKEGNYLIPNLVLPKDKYEKYNIGKYGHLRLNYLKEHKRVEYQLMLIDGTLRKHIVETDIRATERIHQLIQDLKKHSNLTEDIKNTNQLYWVGTMNAIKNQAEEIVMKELIYV